MSKNAFIDTIRVFGLIIYYYLEAFVKLFIPESRKDVTDNLIIITGGSRGLGKELAVRFAKLNAKLAILARNKEKLDEIKEYLEKEFSADVKVYVCDVSCEEEVNQTFEKVKKDFQRPVSILINNAAIVSCLPINKLESKKIRETFDTNILAQFWTIRNVLPEMKNSNFGHIVAISSLAGYYGAPNLVDYCSTKFATNGLMESLRQELRAENYNGIKLTVANPGTIDTGFLKSPRTRFSFLMPILDVSKCSDRIVDAILKEKYRIVMPKTSWLFYKISQFAPLKIFDLVESYVDYAAEPHYI